MSERNVPCSRDDASVAHPAQQPEDDQEDSHKKGWPRRTTLIKSSAGNSALNAVLEHLAGSEGRHALGGNLDLLAGLGVQTLTG